jgi:hypothetical protein
MQFTWNQDTFDGTLARYLHEHESAVWPNCINKKAYYVARKAIWFTRKVAPETISRELEEGKASVLTKLKSGKFSKAKKNVRSFFGNTSSRAPLLALIVQSRYPNSKGERSPWFGRSRSAGAAYMLAEMRKVFGARMRSIAFIKAGWINARNVMERSFTGSRKGLPASEKFLQTYVGKLGGATPATAGLLQAKIWNDANARRDHKAALDTYGGEGLQKAMMDEAADTVRYIEGEMDPFVRIFNSQQR